MNYALPTDRRITVRDLQEAKTRHERWAMLTAYDALTARILDRAQIPVLLVGDSAANVVYGYDTTVRVGVDELLPLAAAVVRGSSRALVVADLPFATYHGSPDASLAVAARFVREAGVHAVKLEGGRRVLPAIEAMTSAGIAVMAHLGLTPQSVHALGGYHVQGRGEAAAELLLDAKAAVAAGAFAVLLEAVPATVAAQITEQIPVPVIGIGAGPDVDAQVLVWQDMAGVTDQTARFVRRYADLGGALQDAAVQFAEDVRSGQFPSASESYT